MKITNLFSSKLPATIILGTLLLACASCQPVKEFAHDAPIKTVVFDLPFPNDLIYSATPDPKIIVGKKNTGGPDYSEYEIGGFDVETGNKLWQLNFNGEVVGQTEKQILVYEAATKTLHFVDPNDGTVTRKITPAPNPLTSKNSLDQGMAFTDDLYLTTKALYTSIWLPEADRKSGKEPAENMLHEKGREDESFAIGITAKAWGDEKVKWFVPPVKQIVRIENRPVIFGDKVFFINPPETIDGNQTYQVVSLTTGDEIFRGKTAGKFLQIGKDIFIEQTDTLVRRFDPLSGADIWQIKGEFHHAAVRAIGNQVTVASPHEDGTRTINLVNAATGDTITRFDFPSTGNTPLRACFFTASRETICNFVAESRTDIFARDFNFWVGYDQETKKVLWRTDLSTRSASSLFPFASDKVRFVDGK